MKKSSKTIQILLAICLMTLLKVKGQSYKGPIIDIHNHAFTGQFALNNELISSESKSMDSTAVSYYTNQLDDANIVLSLTSGPLTISEFWANQDNRLLAGIHLPCSSGIDPMMQECNTWPDVEYLREKILSGDLFFLGEMLNVYEGVSPTSAQMMEYWSLANELDIIIGYHAGAGPPKETRYPDCCPNFDGDMGNPSLLKPVLEKFPSLRLHLMHFGEPGNSDQAIELMKMYPNVYCDITGIGRAPVSIWEPAVKRLFEEGLGDRIMYGSDSSIEGMKIAFQKLQWVSEQQLEDYFFNNAANFLRLNDEKIQELKNK